MKNFLRSKIFWFFFAIIFAVVFAFFLASSREYSSETAVLFSPKNTTSAINMEGTMGNAEEFAKTLHLEKNGVTFERIGHSQMIGVSARDASASKAKELSHQSAISLISVMSRYYNIKTELDMRIIDWSETTIPSAKNIFYDLLAGIILSLILSLAIFNIYDFVSSPRISIVRKMPTFSLAGLSKNMNDFSKGKKKAEEKPEAYSARQPEGEKEKNIITPAPTFARKSAAPENLPFAPEEIVEQKLYPNGNGEKQPKETKNGPPAEKPKEDIFREATPEEVKERLNKLLSGKM